MFHVKHALINLKKLKIHELLFYFFLLFIPIQTRILYQPESAYIGWYFNYHLAYFFYFSDLILISCFIAWFLFDRPKIVLDRIFWLILGFFALVSLSLFNVKHSFLGLYESFKWLELLGLIIYLKHTFNHIGQFYKTAGILFFGAVVQGILGIWQFHMQHGLGLRLLGEYIAPLGTPGLATIDTISGKIIRAYGTMPHPNLLGAFLILGLFMGFLLVSRGPKLYKTLISMGLVIITLGSFLTFSRLAWLGMGIGYLGFALHYYKHSWRNLKILGMIALVSCATIWLGYHQLLQSRISNTDPVSIANRGLFDQWGMTLIFQHPLLGVGVGNYVPFLRSLVAAPVWQYQPAHNILIFIGAELGVLALLIFVWLLVELFLRARTSRAGILKFMLLGLCLLFFAMVQFDHYFVTIQQGRLMFFLVLGLLAALPNVQAEIINDKF